MSWAEHGGRSTRDGVLGRFGQLGFRLAGGTLRALAPSFQNRTSKGQPQAGSAGVRDSSETLSSIRSKERHRWQWSRANDDVAGYRAGGLSDWGGEGIVLDLSDAPMVLIRALWLPHHFGRAKRAVESMTCPQEPRGIGQLPRGRSPSGGSMFLSGSPGLV